MKKLKMGIGGLLMISAMVISDKAAVFAVYVAAALIHEMGHLAAARAMSIEIKEIRLEFSGARIVTDTSLISYRCESILAAAGPLVNVISVLLSLGLCSVLNVSGGEVLSRTEVFMATGEIEIVGLIGFFIASSVMHAAMNLMPVKSFDGGRILECLISRYAGTTVAERVLEITTLLSSLLLWTVALYLMLRVASGLGIFVFAVCIFCICMKKD